MVNNVKSMGGSFVNGCPPGLPLLVVHAPHLSGLSKAPFLGDMKNACIDVDTASTHISISGDFRFDVNFTDVVSMH